MSTSIPPLPPFQPQWPDFQVWWQLAKSAIEEALAGQQSQLDAINAILDPNTLTPDKKPVWMFIYSYLTGEQADIDAKATTYGITTEKTAYDSALSALTTYLATLTSAVAWNDTSGNTTIVDATFRGKFTAVLTAKQALANKMQASAKTLADAAQTTATTANTTANATHLNDKITASSPIPAACLSASDAGSTATITIAANTRVYGDASQLAVAGGSLTGLAYSTVYGVYYDDPTCADRTPTYHSTTTPTHALNNYVSGRHYMGSVTTPASGGGSTTGGSLPPGGGGDPIDRYSTV